MNTEMTRNKDLDIKFSTGVCIILGLILVIFSGYKAYFDSFTFDESLTWLDHMHRSVRNIIIYEYPSANNQLLNTLLMKASSNLLDNSEFMLRLHSWLAH